MRIPWLCTSKYISIVTMSDGSKMVQRKIAELRFARVEYFAYEGEDLPMTPIEVPTGDETLDGYTRDQVRWSPTGQGGLEFVVDAEHAIEIEPGEIYLQIFTEAPAGIEGHLSGAMFPVQVMDDDDGMDGD